MRLPTALLLAGLLPAACANGGPQPVVPDTARLAPGVLGSFADPDVYAVQQAQWAFSSPGNTRGRPAEAARAAASMDYIAGQLYTNPRWNRISALTKEQLLQGRAEVRQVLGIVPNAPSQAVVDSLAATFNALAAGNQPAAEAALSAPIYSRPPAATLQVLNNMPYLQMANISTQHAAGELTENDSDHRRM